MANFLRALFENSQFVFSGSLIKLVDLSDNYAKSTLFMNAKIAIKNYNLFVKNEDFDPDQQQTEFLSFPIDEEMEITYYIVMDHNVQKHSVK